MNELKIFNNPEFGTIRTITKDDEIWFVGKDIAEALGYSNASKAVSVHVDNEDKEFLMINIADTQNGNVPIGQTKTAFINESGLYSLVLSSKLPTAKKFKRWVTHEVLPSIRKNGMYMTTFTAQQTILNPTEFLARAVLVANEQLEKLKSENQIMKPKADYFDALVDRNTLVNLRDTGKEFHMKQKSFITWLIDKKLIYRDQNKKLKPCSGYEDYFYIKECTGKHSRWSGVQTLTTPKGREAIRLLLSMEVHYEGRNKTLF